MTIYVGVINTNDHICWGDYVVVNTNDHICWGD